MEPARPRADVQRSAAAVGEEHELARVVAVLDRHLAHQVGHVRVDDLDDSPRGLDDVQAQRRGDALGDRLAGALDVEPRAAAKEVGRVQPAQHQVGVGDRGLRAARAVADRARLRARAGRSDREHALRAHARDTPAAGADGVHVEHRQV